MNHQQKGKELLGKYLDSTTTKQERLLVEQWYAQKALTSISQPEEQDYDDTKARMWKNITSKNTMKTIKLWPRIIMIAASVILVVFGVYLFKYQERSVVPHFSELVEDVAPGSYGATLTLANGKKIRLTDASNGELAKESGISISKTAEGKLVYSIEETVANLDKINVLSTAKGETYEIRLPDGSSVHLNATSSLTYKASLIEDGKRIVKLRVEGYFEVAKDKQHPFIVKTDNQEVEVLGTHFNISSYADDEVEKTTLLEGSVRLSTAVGSRILKPGQQSQVKDGKITIANTDTDLAVAWKNNEFVFQSETVENIMKMVERWYSVDVIYIGEKTRGRFSGGVSRFDNMSKVLDILEATGAGHFKIQGRKIYVSK